MNNVKNLVTQLLRTFKELDLLNRLLCGFIAIVVVVIACMLAKVLIYILSVVMLGASIWLLWDACKKLKK